MFWRQLFILSSLLIVGIHGIEVSAGGIALSHLETEYAKEWKVKEEIRRQGKIAEVSSRRKVSFWRPPIEGCEGDAETKKVPEAPVPKKDVFVIIPADESR